jgi:outer membrane protein assembly factor BamB
VGAAWYRGADSGWGGRGLTWRGVRWFGIAALTVVLTGCWPQVGGGGGNTRFNPFETALNPDTASSLSVDWRRLTVEQTVMLEPVVWGNRVFVTAIKQANGVDPVNIGAVRAYDRGSGDLLWERSLLPVPLTAGSVEPPAVINGAVWVRYRHDGLPDYTGRLTRLDPDSGAILSDESAGVALSQDPVVAHASLVMSVEGVGYSGNRLVVRDLTTRATLWTYTFPADHWPTTPTVAHGKIIVVTGGPRHRGEAIYAFNASGCGSDVCEPDWVVADPTVPSTFDRAVAGPHGLVYVTRAEGTHFIVRALDAASGADRWRSDARYHASLPKGALRYAVMGDALYVKGYIDEGPEIGDGSGTFDMYPAAGCGEATCTPDWTLDLGKDIGTSAAPTAAAGMVYLGVDASSGTPPRLLGINPADCSAATCTPSVDLALQDPPEGGIYVFGAGPTQMAIAGGQVFIVINWLSQMELVALSPTAV